LVSVQNCFGAASVSGTVGVEVGQGRADLRVGVALDPLELLIWQPIRQRRVDVFVWDQLIALFVRTHATT
jgi:hypothetical protein